MGSTLISKNVTIDGRRTSLRMEVEIWDALNDICHRESLSVHEICSLIDQRRHGSSRTSAVRAFIVTYFRTVAMNSGASDQGPGRLSDLLTPRESGSLPGLEDLTTAKISLTRTGPGKGTQKRHPN